MTSVTVAGGSFDLPRKATAKRLDTTKRDRWLRYGLGVSIAGLLVADTIALSSMTREEAARRADRAAARAAAAEAAALADAASAGAGFAAFDVPSDFSRFAPRVVVPASAAAPVASLAGPSAAISLPTNVVRAPQLTAAAPTTPTAPPAAPVEEAPVSVIEEVVAVVESVPVVGGQVAAIIEQADSAEPVTEVVETEVVAPVVEATDEVPLPLP